MNIKQRLEKLERQQLGGDVLMKAYVTVCPGDWDDPPTTSGQGWRLFESEAAIDEWLAAQRLGLDAGRK